MEAALEVYQIWSRLFNFVFWQLSTVQCLCLIYSSQLAIPKTEQYIKNQKHWTSTVLYIKITLICTACAEVQTGNKSADLSMSAYAF